MPVMAGVGQMALSSGPMTGSHAGVWVSAMTPRVGKGSCRDQRVDLGLVVRAENSSAPGCVAGTERPACRPCGLRAGLAGERLGVQRGRPAGGCACGPTGPGGV